MHFHKQSYLSFIIYSILGFFVFSSKTVAQEAYNHCAKALELCPNSSYSVNNIWATSTSCVPCDDNFSFCFTPYNTIWLKFQTNSSGGFTQIDFKNLVFLNGTNQGNEAQASLLKVGVACDGTTYSLEGNCILNAKNNFIITSSLEANSTYYIALNGAKNGAGTTKAAEFTLDVSISGAGVSRFQPSILLKNKTQFCKNEVATFRANLLFCSDSSVYNWFINDTLVAVTKDSVFNTTALKNNDIVSVTNTCFTYCQVSPSTQTVPLKIIDFIVEAGKDTTILEDEQIQLKGFTTAANYYWVPDLFLSNPNQIDPFVTPNESITYHLKGELNGCIIQDGVNITVIPLLEITNTFSPNGDLKNDTWKIPSLVSFPNSVIHIYDRWGQIVYETVGYNESKAWDGTLNGKPLNDGVYYYTIELNNEENRKVTGYLNLVR